MRRQVFVQSVLRSAYRLAGSVREEEVGGRQSSSLNLDQTLLENVSLVRDGNPRLIPIPCLVVTKCAGKCAGI